MPPYQTGFFEFRTWIPNIKKYFKLILSINYLKIFIFYLAGFGHKDHPQSIDLNCVRLCYQVFLEGSEKGAFTFALKPVVSDPIYDKSKVFFNWNLDEKY